MSDWKVFFRDIDNSPMAYKKDNTVVAILYDLKVKKYRLRKSTSTQDKSGKPLIRGSFTRNEARKKLEEHIHQKKSHPSK